MIFIKIILDLICGFLFSWGGKSFIEARRFIMPIIISCGVSISIHTWWIGLLILPVMGTLCLGYPKFISNQFFARGLWLALQAFIIGLGCLILGHLSWYFYIPYIVIAFLLCGFLYNIKQIIGDAIFGCWLGIIIFLVR